MTDPYLQKDNQIELAEIWRFPVKGFVGERLEEIEAVENSLLPHDRAFALTTGHPLTHEKLAEGWLAKRHFIQLLREERCAEFAFRLTDNAQCLSLYHKGKKMAEAPIEDRASLSKALYDFMPDAFTSQPILSQPILSQPILSQLAKGGYSDTSAPWITLGGRASLEAFARLTGTETCASRFRLNLILATDTAFIERSWAGKIIAIGGVHLEIIEPVGRCGAISVNPQTGQRERDYLPEMEQAWGHTDLGMFARICRGGVLRCGDALTINSL